MSKSATAFRTISEVATLLNVPKHVLRFWELKFPQIKPMKRGGGRRYYRPEDLELLKGIRHLLHAEGYTIKGVQKILREQGVDYVKATAAPEEHPEEKPVAKPKVAARGRAQTAGKAAQSKGAKAAKGATAAPAAAEVRAIVDQAISELQDVRKLLRSVAVPKPQKAGQSPARQTRRKSASRAS